MFLRAEVDVVIMEVISFRVALVCACFEIQWKHDHILFGRTRCSSQIRVHICNAYTHTHTLPVQVGIGGELDPTTAAISAASAVREDGSAQQLFACVACGVTLLDYDHTDILGQH